MGNFVVHINYSMRFLPIIVFLFPALLSFSQDYPNLLFSSRITTVGYWHVGQMARYHVKESSASYKGKSDKPHNEQSNEYDIQLRVTNSTEHTYLFEMTYSNYKTDPNAKEIAKKLAELEDHMKIISVRMNTGVLTPSSISKS